MFEADFVKNDGICDLKESEICDLFLLFYWWRVFC